MHGVREHDDPPGAAPGGELGAEAGDGGVLAGGGLVGAHAATLRPLDPGGWMSARGLTVCRSQGVAFELFEQVFERLALAGVTSTPTSAKARTGVPPGCPRVRTASPTAGSAAGSSWIRRVAAMRRYDDPVDVRRGRVSGTGGGPVEGPEQFLWRGRLWKVHQVVAQWVETGPWWQSRGVHAVLGDESPADLDLDRATGRDTDRDTGGGDRTRTACVRTWPPSGRSGGSRPGAGWPRPSGTRPGARQR